MGGISTTLTLRYLVRSYVTNPTTIKAITEIPAKTPRPMGRTDSFFPGNSNAPVDAAEELPPVPVAPGGDEVPDDEVFVVVGVVADDDGDAVGARVGVTVDRPWKGVDSFFKKRQGKAWNVH